MNLENIITYTFSAWFALHQIYLTKTKDKNIKHQKKKINNK